MHKKACVGGRKKRRDISDPSDVTKDLFLLLCAQSTHLVETG